jgi:hypothetical protein
MSITEIGGYLVVKAGKQTIRHMDNLFLGIKLEVLEA